MLRLIPILAFAATLLYALPLRACAVQQWAMGSNCHDRDVVPMDEPAKGCVPHSDDNDGCVCQPPKFSPARAHGNDLSRDLPNPVTTALVHIQPPILIAAGPHVLHAPKPPPLAHALPLLN